MLAGIGVFVLVLLSSAVSFATIVVPAPTIGIVDVDYEAGTMIIYGTEFLRKAAV